MEPINYHGPHELWNIASGPQILIYRKIYLYRGEESKKKKLLEGAWETSLDLYKYLLMIELIFDVVLWFFISEAKILMRAILNVHAFGLRAAGSTPLA